MSLGAIIPRGIKGRCDKVKALRSPSFLIRAARKDKIGGEERTARCSRNTPKP